MADKISENSVSEIWKRGVPLRDAPDVFGAVRNNSKLKRKARQDASETAAMLKSSVQKAGGEWDSVYDGIESSLASLNEWTGSSIAKVDRLFEQLRLGGLVALGFPIHQAETDDPVIVPPFLLERQYAKWNQGAFVGLGRHFARVAICEAPLTRPSADDPPTPKKRTGRPSYSEGLEIVAAALETQKVPLDSPPWKPLCFQIRSLGIELALPRFDEEHPDDETIRRFLQRRASTKPASKLIKF